MKYCIKLFIATAAIVFLLGCLDVFTTLARTRDQLLTQGGLSPQEVIAEDSNKAQEYFEGGEQKIIDNIDASIEDVPQEIAADHGNKEQGHSDIVEDQKIIDAPIQEADPTQIITAGPSLNAMELFKKIGLPERNGRLELGLLSLKQTDATTMDVSFIGGEATIKNLFVTMHSLTNFSLSGVFKFIRPITFECDVKISVTKEKNRAMPVVRIAGSTVPHVKLKPFEKISVLNLISQVKNIALQNIALSLDSKGRILIAGDSEIFGFRTTAKLMFHVKGFALSVKVPDDWRLSEVFQQIKGTGFDKIPLITPHFIATTSSYFDEDLEKSFASGITLVFKSKFNTGPFKTMYEALGKFNEKTGVPVALPEELMFYGTISPILQNNRFGSSLGINLTFKKDRFILKDIALEVGGYPPALFAKTHIWIKPYGQEEFLIFTGQLEANPQGREVAIAGSMQGDWIDVFGIKGLTIRNVGLEIALGQSMVAGLAKTVVSKAIGRVAGMATGGVGGGGTTGVGGGVAAGGGGAGVGAIGAGVGAVAGIGTGAGGAGVGAAAGGVGGGAAGGEAGDTASSVASSAVPDVLVISRFGITGEIAIGDKTVALGVKIAPELWYNMVLMGKVEYLPITDIVKFLAQIPEKMLAQQKRRIKKLTVQEVKILEEIHKKIKLDKILTVLPDIKFKDLDLLIAPLGGSIGEIVFEQGFRAKGQVVIKIFDKELFNSMIDLELGLMPPLFKAIGTTKNLDIFGLKVTGAGLDGVFGTADDGPTVKIAFSLEDLIGGQAGVVVSGKVEFLGYSSNTDLIIKTDKIYFDTGVNFFGAFNMNIHAETVTTKDGKPDFVFTGNFDDDMAGVLQKSISEQLKLTAEIEQKVTKKIDNAQQELNNALTTLKSHEKALEILSSKMNSIRGQIAGCTKIKKSFSRKMVTNVPRLAKLNAKLAKVGVEYAAKQVSIQTAKLAVKGAIAHLSATKSGINVGGIVVKKTGMVAQKLIETANALRIKQAHFKASLRAFLKGELPEIIMNCTILGKDQQILVRVNPKNQISDLAKAFVKKIKDIF